MSKQKIFKQAFVTELERTVKEADIKELRKIYEAGLCNYDEADVIQSVIEVDEEKPVLDPDDGSDFENAKKIYEYLPIESELAASDRRLWTYLCHVDFRNYVQQRFKLPSKADLRKYILSHWFHERTNDPRSLRRNAIARLWWGIYLTRDPIGFDAEYFAKLRHQEDAYYYSRLLFVSQDIYMTLVERSFGHSRRILIAVLEYIDMHPEFQKRQQNRALARALNQALAFRRVETLPFEELLAVIDELASTIVTGSADENADEDDEAEDEASE